MRESALKSKSRSHDFRIVINLVQILTIVLMLMPLLTIGWLALQSQGALGPLPRYALNSFLLVCLVALLAGSIGLSAAFFVVRFEFRGRGWLESFLILPLALPAFLVAYALVEYFDYAGPLQTALRAWGFQGALPRFRSVWGAVLVLSFALYPYIYIYARQGFLKQSQHVVEVARVMGLSQWQVFWRVELPSIRPAVSIGLSLVALEVLADFGTVDHFGIETLSTGIFTYWLQANELGTAVRMALALALMSLTLLALETFARRNASYVSVDGRAQALPRQKLSVWGAIFVWAFCLLPILGGFVLPLSVFVSLLDFEQIPKGEWSALGQSIVLGAISALVIMILAVFVNRGRFSRWVWLAGMVGYALPGAVLGIGILLPVSALDHQFADFREWIGEERAGLILTGSLFGLILAYVIRFFALGNGAISEAKARISPNLTYAARLLGQTRWGAFWRVERPQLRRPILVASMLVFVDVIKELPASLILRPFGVETLATRLYQAAALEDLGRAALSALFIGATGVLSVMILIRSSRD